MTWYLAGKGYPRPETVLKLAEVLDLDPKDLERDHGKPGYPSLPPPFVWGDAPRGEPMPPGAGKAGTEHPPHHTTAAFSFRLNKRGRVHFSYSVEVDTEMAIRLMDAIRAVDPTLEGETFSDDGDAPA
jgi:hypothetical protein